MARMAEPGRGLARAGPPPSGPDRSIRKNIVLPGYGPSGLHYGKNGYVLSGVERSGPLGGGPARATRGGGARERGAGHTNRHGETADQEIHPYPATRRRRTCRCQQRRGLARSVWQAGNALKNREQNREHGEGNAHANTTRKSGGTRMARSARREAAAAKRHGRAENPVCLRGGWWWDPWPGARAGREASPAQCWREAKCERRGNRQPGVPGRVNVAKPLGATRGTRDAGRRRPWRVRRGREDSHGLVVRANLAQRLQRIVESS